MNDTPERDRVWSDAFGLVLFAVGSITGTLLYQTLTDSAASGESVNWAVRMGSGLLWATGPVPVSLMSLACLLLGALQFLGYQDAQRVTRHLGGSFGVALGLSIVLGAYSPDAGGRLGVIIGGGLAGLVAAPLGALVGLGLVSCSIWAAWLAPSRVTAWERAQEIEKPAVPLQAKADGVTTEESAALAFDGEPGAFPGVVESPYPEDVRVHGQIPDGAVALGAEETPNHDGAVERAGKEEHAADAPRGAEDSAEASVEGDEVSLEAEQGDAGVAGEDLAVDEDSTADDLADEPGEEAQAESGDHTEAALEEGAGEEELGEEDSLEDSEGELASDVELDEVEEEEEEEWEDEEELEEEEYVEEDEAELSEDEDEDEDEFEEGEDEEFEEEEEEGVYEDAAELEEDSEYEEEEELEEDEEDEEELVDEGELEEGDDEELEEAAELEEETSPEPAPAEASEEQGDLFELGEEDAEEESEVILEPQAKPEGAEEELLLKAAELFLDRDRVAVSLLQRQFQLDFEESCAVLDELQQRGLIGPYLGGNRRDILLTREEWQERVGGAT